jgi:hypothetical protein
MDRTIDIQPDGPMAFFGSEDDVAKLCEGGVKLAFTENVDFMLLAITGDTFLTYGPKGGTLAPYKVIEWAFERLPAFGVAIEDIAGVNCPVIMLPSKKQAKRALAYLGKKMRKAAV